MLGKLKHCNRMSSYILMEIVRDIARAQPDPPQIFSKHVSNALAHAPIKGPIEKEAHPVNAEFRNAIAQSLFQGRNISNLKRLD